jgi:cell migration-inducing and hyaluronan-binding protein
MSLPEHPNGKFEGSEISAKTWPRRTPFREFTGNVAHSNYDSFMFDRNINVNNTFGVTGNAHMPKENPADANSRTVETVFENLTAYKNPQWRHLGPRRDARLQEREGGRQRHGLHACVGLGRS